MGNIAIVITGVGVHHNWETDPENTNKLIPDPDRPGQYLSRIPDKDAQVLFHDFVEKLKASGFSVQHASMTYGGAEYKV